MDFKSESFTSLQGPDAPTLDALTALAMNLADQARVQSLHWFRTPLDVSTKTDASPVTIADREVESLLREQIAAHRPTHGIFGEEHGRERLDADYVWVIDPIDGTRSFITGSPLWGTLLALLWRGRPQIGVIDIPTTVERWVGREDAPTLLNGKPCRTSNCASLAEAVLYSTSPDTFSAVELPAFEAVSRAVRMRRFGGDCYSYGLLASGHIDLVVEAELQPYDYFALIPVIQGAGGVITDWRGKPLSLDTDGRVLAAATAELHEEALAVINEHMK
jgi:histidinol phosphatase-like enzyme (inositol monophosphatase family)